MRRELLMLARLFRRKRTESLHEVHIHMWFASGKAYQKIDTFCFRQGGYPGFEFGLAGLVGYRAGFRRDRDEILIEFQELDKGIERRCRGLEMRRHWGFKLVLVLLKFGCECGGFQPCQV